MSNKRQVLAEVMADRSNFSPAAQSEAFHQAADRANDAHDHDELHAAGAIAGSVAIIDLIENDYVTRWLNELWRINVVNTEPARD